MFCVSPPNTTPYSQGCDKVQINQSFGRDIEEQFCAWLLPILEKLSDKDPVPSPERRLMVTWIRDAWERISDEKILRATETAYFSKGMKLSELEDTEDTVCLEIPLQSPPPPGRPSLGDRLPPPPGRPLRATPGLCKGGGG